MAGDCRRSFRHPWRTAATTTQAPSVGGCHPRAGRPKPAHRLQGAANEIRQTFSPGSHLIAKLPTTPHLPNAPHSGERALSTPQTIILLRLAKAHTASGREFHHPWRTAATTTQAPSVGGCIQELGGPDPLIDCKGQPMKFV